jgi:hypothetical protein
MLTTDVRNQPTLLQYLKESGVAYSSLGTTLGGRQILCARLGGDEGEPIVITSGSHATEPAGVIAALELIRRVDVPNPVYIVPIRDVVGWEGYATYLSLALERPVSFNDHEELEALLREHGQLLADQDNLVISRIGGINFLSMRPPVNNKGPMDIWKRLGTMLQTDGALIDRLAGSRLILPENLTEVEGCGLFTHAFTAWVTPEGGVANFNRLFSVPDAPTEVAVIRDLIKRVKPGLVIDLHESQGDRFFIFCDEPKSAREREIYLGATGAVAAAGHRIENLQEMTKVIGADHAAKFVDHGHGLIAGLNEFPGQGWQFSHLCREEGAVTYTPETGRWQPLMQRVDAHVKAALGGIHRFTHGHFD